MLSRLRSPRHARLAASLTALALGFNVAYPLPGAFAAPPASDPLSNIDHIIVIYQENWSFDSLYGSFPGANGVANASAPSLTQLDRLTGNPLASEQGSSTYNNASRAVPVQNPPVPLNGSNVQDTRFLSNTADLNSPVKMNTLLPYFLTDPALALQPTDLTGDIVHRYWQEQFQINGGAMNEFITWSDNPGLVMSRFDATNLPEGRLAQQYTMCDNFFHSAFGGSFLNHQWLIAAATPVYPNAATLVPNNVAVLDANGVLSLNTSGTNVGKITRDGSITPIGAVAFTNRAVKFDQNYAVNTIFSRNLQSHGGDPAAASLLPSQNDSNLADTVRPFIPNIGDRLSAAGVTWKWYSGGWNNALDSSPSNPVTKGVPNTVDPLFQWHHQPFAFFDNYAPFSTDLAKNPDGRNPVAAAHLQDEANFFTDVQNNTLPAVTFIKPLGPDNEHPGYASLQQGQNHVASIVQAVQASPALWAHTLIVVTYDEHGGRWDHVTPPARDLWGPGERVPAIVISPYARRGYVDHTPYDTSSILSTIEARFGLPAMNPRDASAPTMVNALTAHAPFFNGEAVLSNGSAYYLAFANGTPFGYYTYFSDPHYIYHYDLGTLYVANAGDAANGAYFYDFGTARGSLGFFYTSPAMWPYLYDFNLGTYLLYAPDTARGAGFYSTNPRRFIRVDNGQTLLY